MRPEQNRQCAEKTVGRASPGGQAGMLRSCGSLAALLLGLVLAPVAMPQLPGAVAHAQQAGPVPDQPDAAQASMAALEASLRIPELFEVIAQEGHKYGESIDQVTLGGRGGLRWQASVAHFYDPVAMRARFSHHLAAALADQPAVVADAVAFFEGDAGQTVTGHELAARRALLDPDAKEAAEVAAEKLRDSRAPRMRMIRDLITAGDLIEANVASGLTGSAAFSEALAATLPEAERLPEADRMAQVWRQESGIRAETAAWLLTFMVTAYEPLTDVELQAYIDFTRSDAGRGLNQAVMAAYGETFREVMAGLGHEAGLVLRGLRI